MICSESAPISNMWKAGWFTNRRTSTLPKIQLLNALQEQPSRPRDCALLVSVPTTWQEFSADYSAGADFVGGYTRSSGGSTAEDGWNAYQPYASLARHVMNQVKNLGVPLFERATLAHLHSA